MNLIGPIALLVGLLLVLAMLQQLQNKLRSGQNSKLPSVHEVANPYRKQNYLLSRAEREFYVALRSVASGLVVCPKVRLSDFLFVAKGHTKRRSAQNQINQKHVDFLLCSEDDLRPVAAIELDDKSHSTASAQARDAFVAAAYESAGLPLLRVRAQRSYNRQELAMRLHELL